MLASSREFVVTSWLEGIGKGLLIICKKGFYSGLERKYFSLFVSAYFKVALLEFGRLFPSNFQLQFIKLLILNLLFALCFTYI